MKTIEEAACLAGVTIETLRHYDMIGLLEPRTVPGCGDPLYGTRELLRLREILVWRLLDFSLGEVVALLGDPAHDRAEALLRQRELAGERLRRLEALTRSLDHAVSAAEAGEDDVFGAFAIPSLYEDHPAAKRDTTGRA
jgi:DNA-binding transcriptional MerR regulator